MYYLSRLGYVGLAVSLIMLVLSVLMVVPLWVFLAAFVGLPVSIFAVAIAALSSARPQRQSLGQIMTMTNH